MLQRCDEKMRATLENLPLELILSILAHVPDT